MSADEAWADVVARLEGARDVLQALAEIHDTGSLEWMRLRGKREGVILALSYARDAQRMTGGQIT